MRLAGLFFALWILAGAVQAYSPFYGPDINTWQVRIADSSGIDVNYSYPAFSALGKNFPAYASYAKDGNLTIDFNVWDVNLLNDLTIGQMRLDLNYYSIPLCGNAIVDIGEECDDGDAVATNGCNNSCQTAFGSESLINTQAGDDSGIIWHPARQKFIWVDNTGELRQFDRDGTNNVLLASGLGDLEGITLGPDPMGDIIFLGIEYNGTLGIQNAQIREFDLSDNTAKRSFTLTGFPPSSGSGLEALEFIPKPGDPEGGVFYAGSQSNGTVYVYHLPILSSAVDTTVSFQGTVSGVSGRTDLASLSLDRENEVLFWLWDNGTGADTIRATSITGEYLNEWSYAALSADNAEGLVLLDGNIFLADDSTGRVYRAPFAGIHKPENGNVIAANQPLNENRCSLESLAGLNRYVCQWDWNLSNASDNNYVIRARIWDSNPNNGNENTSQFDDVSFMVDNSAPSISDARPSAAVNSADSTPDFNFAVSDAESGTGSCSGIPFVNGVAQTALSGTLSGGRCLFTLSPAASVGSTVLLQGQVRDLAGNPSADLNTALVTIQSATSYPPDVNVVSIDNNLDTLPWGFFSNARDGNLSLDFNVQDADSNNLRVDVNFSASALPYSGTPIVVGVDLNALPTSGPYRCADTNFQNSTRCSIDWNTTGITDGNYFLLVTVTDGTNVDQNTSDRNAGVDNTKPSTSWDGNAVSQRFDANVHLTCSDGVGAGCLTTMYRKDADSTSVVSFGAWTVFDQNVLFHGDGNWAIDFNSSDRVSNSGDVNSFFVLIDSNAPWAGSAGPTGTLSSASVTLLLSTSENATCRFSTSENASFDALTSSANMATTGSTSHSQGLTLANGSYTYYFKCRDAADNNSNDANATFSVSVASTPPPQQNQGGGGGGGGGGGPSPSPSDPANQLVSRNILANTQVTLSVPAAATHPIYRVSFHAPVSIDVVTFSITPYAQKPASISVVPSNARQHVYAYVGIVSSLATNQFDHSVDVFFRVPSAWINDHNLSEEPIVLKHWHNNQWQTLPTQLESVDAGANGFTRFKAQTPGFSIFAIVGGNEQFVHAPLPSIVTQNPLVPAPIENPADEPAGETPATADTTAGISTNTPSDERPLVDGTTIVITLALVAILGLGTFFVSKFVLQRKFAPSEYLPHGHVDGPHDIDDATVHAFEEHGPPAENKPV